MCPFEERHSSTQFIQQRSDLLWPLTPLPSPMATAVSEWRVTTSSVWCWELTQHILQTPPRLSFFPFNCVLICDSVFFHLLPPLTPTPRWTRQQAQQHSGSFNVTRLSAALQPYMTGSWRHSRVSKAPSPLPHPSVTFGTEDKVKALSDQFFFL